MFFLRNIPHILARQKKANKLVLKDLPEHGKLIKTPKEETSIILCTCFEKREVREPENHGKTQGKEYLKTDWQNVTV